MRNLASLAALALCAACVPVAVTPGVRLDDVSAAAYQAGRTQQAAQTHDAATATAGAFVDLRTATSAARTETAAQMVATGQAASIAATLRALTPTATPPPSQTPRPTWTATPDATVAALRVERATAERDAAQRWAVLPVIVLVVGGLLVIFAATWAVGMMWASWEERMGRARRSRYLMLGPRTLDMVTGEFIDPDPAPVVIEAPAGRDELQARLDAETEQWRRALRVFFTEGDRSGFSMRAMCKPVATRVLSEDDWQTVTSWARKRGILRDDGGNVGMTWGHGQTLQAVLEALPSVSLPPGRPVDCTPRPHNSATQRRTAQHTTQAA